MGGYEEEKTCTCTQSLSVSNYDNSLNKSDTDDCAAEVPRAHATSERDSATPPTQQEVHAIHAFMIRRQGTLITWVVSETYVHLVAHVPSFCLIGIESTRSHPMSEGVTISSTSDCTLRYLEMASPNFFKSNTGFPDSVRLTVASAINSLKYLTGYRQRKQSGWGY